MTEAELDSLIAKHISQTDHKMHMIVGFFFSWYSMGELAITSFLMTLSNAHDLERFGILCKGLDAKAKIERIKTLAALNGGLGQNLSDRLQYFYSTIAGLRNRLAHSALRQKETKVGEYQIPSIGVYGKVNLQWEELEKLGTDVTATRLLELGSWLKLFTDDMGQAMATSRPGQIPEIAAPRTSLPKDALPNPPRQAKPTKKRKPKGRAP